VTFENDESEKLSFPIRTLKERERERERRFSVSPIKLLAKLVLHPAALIRFSFGRVDLCLSAFFPPLSLSLSLFLFIFLAAPLPYKLISLLPALDPAPNN